MSLHTSSLHLRQGKRLLNVIEYKLKLQVLRITAASGVVLRTAQQDHNSSSHTAQSKALTPYLYLSQSDIDGMSVACCNSYFASTLLRNIYSVVLWSFCEKRDVSHEPGDAVSPVVQYGRDGQQMRRCDASCPAFTAENAEN